jgi:hypothetical protein
MAHDISIREPLLRGRLFPRLTVAAQLRSLVENDALSVSIIGLWTALLSSWLPMMFVPDSWLTFVDGRLIALHGLPREDTLAFWTLGRRWIDQQWGAHLVYYEVVRYGGIRAAGALTLACVAAALGSIAVVARKLGASPRSTAVGLLLPVAGAPWLAEVRTQTLALPLFVAVYALLAFDARAPGRRVLAVLPVCAIWANVHGSVVLAAGLVVVHGVLRLRKRRDRIAAFALIGGAPLAVFASPYNFALLHYYRSMLLNPTLARVDVEWRPASFDRTTAIFFLTAFAVAVLAGRHRSALTSFEQWALGVLLVGALMGARNIVWFELAAAVSLPRLLDAAWPTRPPTLAVRRANVVVASLTVMAAATLIALQTAQPASRLEPVPLAAAAAVAHAAGDHGLIVADDTHADWLLWHEPALAGRIAYDVRFELLDRGELARLPSVQQPWTPFWRRCSRGVRIVTSADAAWEHQLFERGLLGPDAHRIADEPGFHALAQAPTAPACRL